MSKMSNHWEIPLSSFLPYLQWNEIESGETDSWDISRHNHASYELHIIMAGDCSLSVSNTEVVLEAGQGLLIAPDVFHAPNRISEQFLRFSVLFGADCRLTEQLLLPSKEGFQIFDIDDTINFLCNAIAREVKQTNRLLHNELLSNQFAQLMIHVFRVIIESPGHPQNYVPDPKQLEDMAIIDRFFVTTPPKLRSKENLAKLLHCSERQLLRKIYTLYGMSFREKLIISRVDTAQHLLRSTDKSIDEISSIVGYSDNAAFYRAFRLHTKMTPIKFRKQEKAIVSAGQ